MSSAIWDGTSYRTLVGLSVWDGAAYRQIVKRWVWDGAAWRQDFALGTIATPTCTASWRDTTGIMSVSVTPTGTPPSNTTWHFTSDQGRAAQCTEPTRSVSISETSDGTTECWTVIGSAPFWHDSAPSAQSCATKSGLGG